MSTIVRYAVYASVTKFNSSRYNATYMRQGIGTAVVQIMAYHQFRAKPIY